MTHFGIVCPPAIGHLNPMCALGEELQRRGHDVTLFGTPDVASIVAASTLRFRAFSAHGVRTATLDDVNERLGRINGLAALRYTIDWIQEQAVAFLQAGPETLTASGVDALLVDQVSVAGGTVADALGLPFLTICNALPINREADIPPFFTSWRFGTSPVLRLRNRIGWHLFDRLTSPLREVVAARRREWKLPAYVGPEGYLSSLAQISQLPMELDFPRCCPPACFHYTGPLRDPSGIEPLAVSGLAFPFETLAAKPLIYASLGTLQNRQPDIFRCIAAACVGLDVQLVISLGRRDVRDVNMRLPGDPLVVPFVPQQKLIDRSALVITHAGLNTTLGALGSGVPLIAVPITNEQPGIAARLERTGAAAVVPLRRLKPSRLRATVRRVLETPSYRQNAMRLSEAIHRTGGVRRAAEIVERVVKLGRPILAYEVV